MSKKVVWDAPKLTSANRKSGTYSSFQEFLQKANALHAEQEQAKSYLQKAMPALVALLKYKLEHQEPIVVMRPLQYQTSEIVKGDAIDDAFYKGSSTKERVNDKFTDVIKTIMPGTMLMLKALDTSLQEFVFLDAKENEHAISFADRDKLLTQTNIFEEVKAFLDLRGE